MSPLTTLGSCVTSARRQAVASYHNKSGVAKMWAGLLVVLIIGVICFAALALMLFMIWGYILNENIGVLEDPEESEQDSKREEWTE